MGVSIPLLVAGVTLLAGAIYGGVVFFSPQTKAATPKIPDSSTFAIATSILENVILLSTSTTLSPSTVTGLPAQVTTTKLKQFVESPASSWIPDAKPTTREEKTIEAPESITTSLNTNVADISTGSPPENVATTRQTAPASATKGDLPLVIPVATAVVTKKTSVRGTQKKDVQKSSKLALPTELPTPVAQLQVPTLDVPIPSAFTTGKPVQGPEVDKKCGHKDGDEEEDDDDDDEEEEEDDSAQTSGGPGHPTPRPSQLGEEEDEQDGYLEEEGEVDDYEDSLLRLKDHLSQHTILKRPQTMRRQSVVGSKDKATTSRKRTSELDQWIDDTVDQQSAFYEGELFEVIDKLLQDVVSAPKGYRSEEDNLSSGLQRHPQEQEQRLEQDIPPPNSSGNDKGSETPPKPFSIMTFVENLARPFVLELRADIRSVLIWICLGASGSPIDGRIGNSSDFSKKEAIDDKTTIMHENRTLSIQDILDPKVTAMAFACLKNYVDTVMREIQYLFWTRLAQSRDLILDQIRNLIPLPRFLIPFSNEIEQGEVTAEVHEDENVGVEGTNGELSVSQQTRLEQEQALGRQKPEDAFAIWLVANVMNELKVATDRRARNMRTAARRKAGSRSREEVSSSANSLPTGCEWLKERLQA